jgi:hypothetical protein
MRFHLFHDFGQFLWLLVINIHFFLWSKFFPRIPSNYSPRVVEGLIWFIYCFLQNKLILQELVVDVCGVEGFPYIVGNSTFPIHPYLLKNFKPQNLILEMDKIQFD